MVGIGPRGTGILGRIDYEYRRNGTHAKFQESIAMANATSYPVTLKTLPNLRFAGLDQQSLRELRTPEMEGAAA